MLPLNTTVLFQQKQNLQLPYLVFHLYAHYNCIEWYRSDLVCILFKDVMPNNGVMISRTLFVWQQCRLDPT